MRQPIDLGMSLPKSLLYFTVILLGAQTSFAQDNELSGGGRTVEPRQFDRVEPTKGEVDQNECGPIKDTSGLLEYGQTAAVCSPGVLVLGAKGLQKIAPAPAKNLITKVTSKVGARAGLYAVGGAGVLLTLYDVGSFIASIEPSACDQDIELKKALIERTNKIGKSIIEVSGESLATYTKDKLLLPSSLASRSCNEIYREARLKKSYQKRILLYNSLQNKDESKKEQFEKIKTDFQNKDLIESKESSFLAKLASEASCLPLKTQVEIACAVGTSGVLGKAPSKKLLARWQAKVKETKKQKVIANSKENKNDPSKKSDAEIRAANKSLAPNVKNVDPLSAKEYALFKSPAVKVQENIDEAGANASYFVDLQNGSKGVFKPCKGSSDPNVGCLNEVLAFKMDRKLGLNLVPETIIKPVKIDNEDITGSFQRKIENATEAYKGKAVPQQKELVKQQIFDKIIGNQDIDVSLGDINRNSSNYLVSQKGKITSIDHGLAFHPDYKITNLTPEQRSFLKSVKGQRVTQKLRRMLNDDTSKWMENYINPEEAERFKERIKFILSQL